MNKFFSTGISPRFHIAKMNLDGIDYIDGEFRCSKKICHHLSCIQVTKQDGEKCKAGRIVQPNEINNEEMLYESSMSLPGCKCIEKGHEFHGNPVIGQGFGIIKLESLDSIEESINYYSETDLLIDRNQSVYSLIETAYLNSKYNSKNPEWIYTPNIDDEWIENGTEREQFLIENVQNTGIISRVSNSNCQENYLSNLYYLTNKRNEEGKQIINSDDIKLIKLLNRNISEEKSAFDFFKEVPENQTLLLSGHYTDVLAKWYNLSNTERLEYCKLAEKTQNRNITMLSDIVTNGPPGIYVAYGCSVLNIQFKKKNCNQELEVLGHTVKGGPYYNLYTQITKQISNMNIKLNRYWSAFCSHFAKNIKLEDEDVKIPVIIYDDDDREDFSLPPIRRKKNHSMRSRLNTRGKQTSFKRANYFGKSSILKNRKSIKKRPSLNENKLIERIQSGLYSNINWDNYNENNENFLRNWIRRLENN